MVLTFLQEHHKKIFDSVTPNIFVKDTKKINHSREDLIIVDVDIDESEGI